MVLLNNDVIVPEAGPDGVSAPRDAQGSWASLHIPAMFGSIATK